MTEAPIKENHWRGHFTDQSILQVDHYTDRGLDLKFYWQQIFFKPTPSNEDMEIARLEACNVFLKMGGNVIITILDSLQVPENDRNASIDMREGHKKIIGSRNGWPVNVKKETGDPGDQYYDWTPLTPKQVEQRLVQVRQALYQETKKSKRGGAAQWMSGFRLK